MNIFDKLLGALKLKFLNRENSPSIKAGGNIIAGGDIVVGNNKENSKKIQRVGLLEEGKNNKYIDCEMEGPDFGMIDRGENTEVINSKMRSNNKE